MKKWLFLLFYGFLLSSFTLAQVDEEWEKNELIFLSSKEDMSAYNEMMSLISTSEEQKNKNRISSLREKIKDTTAIEIKIRFHWLEGHFLEHIEKRGLALEKNLRAYKLSKENNLLQERAFSAKNLATNYIRLGLEEQAIIYALDASQIFTKINDKQNKASLLYTIGDIYFQVENYRQAINYYDYGYDYAVKNSFLWEQRYTANNLGVAYRELGSLDSSLYHYRIAQQLATQMKDSIAIALVAGNIGEILYKKKDYEQAIYLLEQDIRLSTKHGNLGSAANAFVLLGRIYRERNDLLRASIYLDSAYKIATQKKMIRTMASVYEEQAKLLVEKDSFETALYLERKAKSIRDSLTHREVAINLAAIQNAFENGQAVAQVSILEKENENKQIIIFAITIGFIIAILLLTVLIYQNQQKRQLNKKLSEKNKETAEQNERLKDKKEKIAQLNKRLNKKVEQRTKELEESVENLAEVQNELDSFMYRASHDLRAPLVRLEGLNNLLKMSLSQLENSENLQLSYEVFTYLDLFESTLKQMDTMLRRLMQLHDLIEEELFFSEIDSVQLFIEEVKTAAYDYVPNGISIHTTIEIHASFITDVKWLRLIVINLLRNSLLYHTMNEQPKIDLFIKVENEKILIEVTDNGEGIATELMGAIFNMFVRSSERSIGNGLGLYLVKKAVNKLGGRVFCNSTPFEKTTFSVYIPNQKEASKGKMRENDTNEMFVFA
ncbi:tetratricopeptide repeat-containing sensor histidine kinase [Bernardetia sp.]|uniref:tetratricopeptide repeat-containing sensor histidine kinase n=1 Tax=Bernardetia sp. TaxID=1937974 RepID=UPI0025BECBAC|nr:tetratricopeptide repeat-containing sensor histidine kinase [Bernardetia sp.]